MDAAPGTLGLSNQSVRSRATNWRALWLVGWCSGATLAACGLVALWLLVRRTGGALQRPLPAPWLIFVGVSLPLLAALASAAPPRPTTGHGQRPDEPLRVRPQSILLLLVLAVLAGSISLPGSHPLAITALWCGVVLSGVVTVRRRRHRDRDESPTRLATDLATGGQTDATQRETDTDTDTDADADADAAQHSLADHVDLQWTRGIHPTGDDFFAGQSRVRMEAGQRVAHVHLAICPPIAAPLQVQAEVICGPDATVEVGQQLPQGIRLDLRLATVPTEPVEIVVEFYGEVISNARS
jgi:hypothetical protein